MCKKTDAPVINCPACGEPIVRNCGNCADFSPSPDEDTLGVCLCEKIEMGRYAFRDEYCKEWKSITIKKEAK